MKKRVIKGQIISPGVAKGEVCFINFTFTSPSSKDNLSGSDAAKEITRFEKEADSVINELEDAVKKLQKDSFFEEAEIIQFHIFLLKDARFHRRVHEKIKTNRPVAEVALEHIMQEMLEVLESSESLVFSQRAADVKDVVTRLKKKLAKEDSAIFDKSLKNVNNPVVTTKELFPSLVLEKKKEGVNAFIVERGTSLSHAAILAKSFGLPVLKVENLYSLGLRNNIEVFVDAIKGKVVINPHGDEIVEANELTFRLSEIDKTKLPIKIWINIVDPLQIIKEDLEGVEGVGLYRTEILFMEKEDDFPTEDEQFQIYSSLFKESKDFPVTVRTLDIGGDKTLPYFSFGPQENPYLGFRAHRIYRFHPEIFITQLRVILRAGADACCLRILYPMIENVDELLFVQSLLKQAIRSLKDEGMKYKKNFLQGILVEVPSAVWSFRELLRYVDFASVGTNDLLQYFFAVDRNNANVCSSYWPESPVSLRMLKSMVETAKELNKPLSICGEIASDVHFLPLLVGLGFEHISIDFHTIPSARKILSSLDVSACRRLIQECLNAEKTDDVKIILDEFNSFYEKYEPPSLRENNELVDPICKMVVHKDGNKLIVDRDGRRYYFCSKQCRDKFIGKGDLR